MKFQAFLQMVHFRNKGQLASKMSMIRVKKFHSMEVIQEMKIEKLKKR